MSETQKTGIFAAVAVIAVLLAYVTRPVTVTKQDEKGELTAGELLFKEEASDVTKAASLKITKFDENKLSMESFEVVRDKNTGLWKIPSEFDYPADAEEQLKNATAPLADLKILSVIEDAGRGDHALYGVVEPTDKLEAGVTGVGMLVSVSDNSGKSMASLIVGKEVDKAQQNLHYVRIPNQDPVYTVEIDTAAFDTNFKKWIKPDLLQVKSFDINSVGIRDYQIEQQQTREGIRAAMLRTMEADASYDTSTSKWKLDRLVTFESGQPKETELGENEELKSDKLNSLRTAAQSLQIVGVRPKPKGLAADLKAEKDLLDNNENLVSLLEQGFIPHNAGDTTEILATAGETLLTTQDGVRYTLRFGEERVVSAALEGDAKGDKAEPAESKRERYLLVTATLDESRFPPPELQPVPETIEDLKKLDAEKEAAEAAKKSATSGAAASPGTDGKESPESDSNAPTPAQPDASAKPPAAPATPAPDAQPDNAKPNATSEAAQPDAPKSGDDAQPQSAQPDAPKADEPKPESASACDAEPSQDERSPGESSSQEPAAAVKPSDDQPASNQPPAAATAAQPADDKPAPPATDKPADKPAQTDEELKDRLSVVQSDITKANQRLIDARTEKLEAARKKVQELNARFADWYYLIDEASFKQLMLKRDVLIGPKAPAGGSTPAAPTFPGLPSTPTLPSN